MGSTSWNVPSPGEWLWGSEPMRWRRVFPGRADQVTVARVFAAGLFEGSGREEDVAVVVAELATNAVRHSRSGAAKGWFGLEITLAEKSYIGVTDLGGGCNPAIRSENPNCEPRVGGRGLLMVSRLATATGIYGNPVIGHTVWADMDLRRTPQIGPVQETGPVREVPLAS
ncbi:ATP-binding protein [Actinomadura algeriensis]|uniref:Anti-sigma regulatory factor (Ser/Thr protein kinase) n=1 Tax=Actinomadura algeriensis TaxID=1679523 RepID=A0ABR9JIH6_9ACTN|nr:ATP-binding protein [Actinomadura algeriensis]MBE1530359.1 anti-sigma regulatory factor (Ser/Thr protein kinase) [Actinomadura algeriensis]